MLILTRRIGETICIGTNVTGTVLGRRGNQIQIGTDAPRDVMVHGEDLDERTRGDATQRRRFNMTEGLKRRTKPPL